MACHFFVMGLNDFDGMVRCMRLRIFVEDDLSLEDLDDGFFFVVAVATDDDEVDAAVEALFR